MRLIDADELKTLYDDAEFADEKWRVPIRVILANIDDMPTVDPVKHGQWVKTGQSFLFPERFICYSCSVCGYDSGIIKYCYCPNCGALMDEVINEQE